MDLLTAEHVTKRYAAHTALDDVSLAIPKGSVYGLLGPNGAGKTTLIRIINRITAPDSGRVLLGGREIAPADIYRIGYLPEERGLYKKMKVGEQAVFFARLKGLSRREAVVRLKRWSGSSASRRGGTRRWRSFRRAWPRRCSSSSRCSTNPNC